MIVTIDGPAGVGKSTVARELARRLGFRYLDTGAMYRAVALAGLRHQVDWGQPEQLAGLCLRLTIELEGDRVLLDGEDVTDEIRTPHVTTLMQHAASNPAVRRHLVERQREMAAGLDVISEGRDQGTVAFPQAACKVFLTASPEERARRRALELAERGQANSPTAVLTEQNRRDRQDATRPVGPLAAATDAVEVSTDGLSLDEVVDLLEAMVRDRMPPER